MRKASAIIVILSSIEHGSSVYDTDNALWLRKFKESRPNCIKLTFNETLDSHLPIFKAELTPQGIAYLNKLREESHEVFGLRQAIP